jgi:hypothetical protein
VTASAAQESFDMRQGAERVAEAAGRAPEEAWGRESSNCADGFTSKQNHASSAKWRKSDATQLQASIRCDFSLRQGRLRLM